MTGHLLESLGLYGGTFVIAFIAGMFPLVSVEVFLVSLGLVFHVDRHELIMLVPLAAVGHQIAKTICYYAGVGALELPRGKIKERIEAARARIDRWNKRPGLVMVLGSTIGLPPIYLLAFIAGPLMNVRFWRFTVICFTGRLGRYAVMTAAGLLF